jgi:tetratricopeptide (TPR) repeat protein
VLRKKNIVLFSIYLLLFLISVLSCQIGSVKPAFSHILDRLAEWELRHEEALDNGEHVLYLQQLVELAQTGEERSNAIRTLLAFHARYPYDPYGAFVSLILAEAFENEGQTSFSRHYYERSLRYPLDVRVSGEPVQLRAARKLYSVETDPARKITLARMFIEKYASFVDVPRLLYELGFLYEQNAQFDESYKSFTEFLKNSGSVAQSDPNTVDDIRNRLNLYTLKRDWGYKSLNDLVNRVKTAIRAKDVRTVSLLRSKNRFFSMSWLQEKNDFNSVIDFDMNRFIYNSSGIYFENQLEPFSNSQEAFLKSRGWGVQMPVWYLYFRKVDFPADPNYHNSWEWAGVYFGDTLQEVEANRGL